MRTPLWLRNLTVFARAVLLPDAMSQLIRRVRTLHRRDGLSWRQILYLTGILLKGERAILHDRRLIVSSVIPPLPSPAFEALIRNPMELAYCPGRAEFRTGPVSLFLSVTAQCPCRCPHCSRANRATPDAELSGAELKQVIADLKAMNVATIGITGGEPLCRGDLAEIIGAIGDAAGSILFTTGIGLTPEKAREFKRNGLLAMAISLDFVEAEEHDRFRGHPGAHAAALRAMEYAAGAGLHVIAMCVVVKKNLSEEAVFRLARLAQRHGAAEIRLLEPVRSGRYLDSEEETFYTPADRARLIAIHHRGNRTWGMPKFTTYWFIEGEEKFGCGAGILHSYLGETGELYPCDFIPAGFGNVRRTRLPELWTNMRRIFGTPRSCCMANALNAAIRDAAGETLPLAPDRSIPLCRTIAMEQPSSHLADCFR